MNADAPLPDVPVKVYKSPKLDLCEMAGGAVLGTSTNEILDALDVTNSYWGDERELIPTNLIPSLIYDYMVEQEIEDIIEHTPGLEKALTDFFRVQEDVMQTISQDDLYAYMVEYKITRSAEKGLKSIDCYDAFVDLLAIMETITDKVPRGAFPDFISKFDHGLRVKHTLGEQGLLESIDAMIATMNTQIAYPYSVVEKAKNKN